MDKCLVEIEDLSLKAKEVFGEDYIINNVVRLYGGAKKGTFKIECTNGFNFVLYIWDLRTTYVSNYQDKSDMFLHNGAKIFANSEEVFKENNIPTQKLYAVDTTQEKYPFDYALVEYIQGKEIEFYMQKAEQSSNKYFEDLRNEIKKLHSIKSQFAGQPKSLMQYDFCCESFILDKINKDMNYLVRNSKDVALGNVKIKNCYMDLYKNIMPRKEYVLIHGELGPNHVIVGEDNKNYFINIDGAKYFDIEYETSYMEFRFGKYYKYLKEDNLDINRMKFYRFAHHISYLAGAIQLKEINYYQSNQVEKMIDCNLEEIAKFI